MRNQNISTRLLTTAFVVLALCHAACGGGSATSQNHANRPAASTPPPAATAAPAQVTPTAEAEASASPAATPGGGAAAEQGDGAAEDFVGTVGVVEKEGGGAPALLMVVRTASREKFDRVVFEFEGARLPGYRVEYVDRPVRQCGSGEVVPVAGDAWLHVRLTPANAHTEAGQPTVKDRALRLDYPNLKELIALCDFEAEVEWVFGLASPKRFRVLELTNPSRLVVDVKK